MIKMSTEEGKKKESTEKPEATKDPDKVIRIEHVHEFKGIGGEKPAEKPTEKPTEKPVEKPAEKPVEKPAEKPAVPPVTPPPVTPPTVTPEELKTLKDEKGKLETQIADLTKKVEEGGKTKEELTKVKKDLEERTNQLSAIALKEFEVEKVDLITKTKKSWTDAGNLSEDEIKKREEYMQKTIVDPDQLKFISEMSEKVFGYSTPAGTDAGKGGEAGIGSGVGPPVPPTPKALRADMDPYKIVIDELYGIMADPTKTQLEKDEANKRVDKLFMSLIKGAKKAQKVPYLAITKCPACGFLIPKGKASSCPDCGWKHVVPRSK